MRRPGVSHPSPTTVEDFRRALDERAIQPRFQPLVDLQHRHVLGYEALARGPMGSALESPAALFGPPSRCCAGWFPSTDHRGIAEGWVV
jgi:hypothetical protein